MDKALQRLMGIINYSFKDIHLLELALTHRSMGGKNNERMEFLGDSLVNLMIAEAIYLKLGKANEGEMSRLRSSLVSGEALAGVARELGIGEYIYLGQGELKSGGHNRSSILACTVESIIGGIYLDSDFNTCKATVLGWFKTRIDSLSLEDECKDTKTRLQEYLQGKKMPLPKYTLMKTEGQAHDQMFTVQCEVMDLGITMTAKSTTRRQAEKDAAKLILEKLNEHK